jgi:hypothetical protein
MTSRQSEQVTGRERNTWLEWTVHLAAILTVGVWEKVRELGGEIAYWWRCKP